jgi:tRNA (cytidine/uridine-2'-O-)-methyltransferase
MFDVVLYQPEIPPNTGNVLRLCANTGCRLHLIRPLGFLLTDRALRRAGLDYAGIEEVIIHPRWNAAESYFAGRRMLAFTTRALASYADARYAASDVLVFGPETRGLPETVLRAIGEAGCMRVPMRPGSRSLNLANAVAIVMYEAWRQLQFAGSG